jgi:hypothetical protein
MHLAVLDSSWVEAAQELMIFPLYALREGDEVECETLTVSD